MMHISFLAAGLLLGLDSFVVSVPLGATSLSASHRRHLALAFAVCDGLASFLGQFLPLTGVRSLVADIDWLAPAILASYGFFVFFLGRRAAMESPGGRYLPTFAMPFLLSLDNLVCATPSAPVAAQTLSEAVTAGAISGVFSLVGLSFGVATANQMRERARWAAGGLFLLAATVIYAH